MRADRTIGFIEPMARPRFRGGHDWRPSSGRRHGPLPDFSTRARGPSSSVLRATCARITVGTCSRRTREPITYHLVVATGGAPEDLVRSLKSWLTRRLVASRGATSQDPALVEAREHCIPLDGPLSRPGGALRGARSRRRAKRDLTNQT